MNRAGFFALYAQSPKETPWEHPINTDTSKDNGTIEVEAFISEWRDGQYGPYAYARITTPGAPTTSASCRQSVKGLEPPLGTPFRCRIKLQANGKGYAVTELLVEGLPETLSQVEATVQGTKGYDLLLRPLEEAGYGITITLSGKLLGTHQLGAIPPDYPVLVDAARSVAGYEATVLHAPSVAEVLDPAHSPVTLVCSVLSPWDAGQAQSKGAYVGIAADSGLTAKIWVNAAMLRAAGIPALYIARDDEDWTPEDEHEALQAWETVLRQGDQAERAGLHVDRLALCLEWVDAKQQWRVCRLAAPRAVREPGCEGEVVDWVYGVASGEVVTASRKKPQAPQDQDELASSAATYQYIMIDYQDNRLGRGSVRLSGAQRIAAAGLGPDVPVVVTLVGKGPFWEVRALHRAWPLRNEKDE